MSVSPVSGSLDPVALKLTASGAGPLVGFAAATAVGVWFPLE